MRNKHKIIFTFTCFAAFILLFLQPALVHAADAGTIVDSGTKERLMEQYGLEPPKPSFSISWTGMDARMSTPIQVFLAICGLAASPYLAVIWKFILFRFS
ncbi:hypothetical protein [Paenibacillus graminis]|uniref:Uncharacterized protein n=1 Tax=Paenibacillus graminis TaxID=189425 RepID=A0A089M0I4_9BACL|nr:hypothetical protein [Paenibacillus graminis]AIQ66692.1 hypothetical protein PGRAT_02775 [Paenibacillus graminis]